MDCREVLQRHGLEPVAVLEHGVTAKRRPRRDHVLERRPLAVLEGVRRKLGDVFAEIGDAVRFRDAARRDGRELRARGENLPVVAEGLHPPEVRGENDGLEIGHAREGVQVDGLALFGQDDARNARLAAEGGGRGARGMTIARHPVDVRAERRHVADGGDGRIVRHVGEPTVARAPRNDEVSVRELRRGRRGVGRRSPRGKDGAARQKEQREKEPFHGDDCSAGLGGKAAPRRARQAAARAGREVI